MVIAVSSLPVGDFLPPGRCSAITVDGDLAYVVVDDRLAVLNVADPEKATKIGESGAPLHRPGLRERVSVPYR